MEENTNQRVFFADLKTFCCQAYVKAGVPAAEAEIVADLLVRADLRGVETHGVTPSPNLYPETAERLCSQGVPTHTRKG